MSFFESPMHKIGIKYMHVHVYVHVHLIAIDINQHIYF